MAVAKSELNLLFCSVGRRVELLRAFKRSYRALDLSGKIIGIDVDPLAPALQIVDRSYIVPRLDTPEYIGNLVEICRRERVGVVFPLIDPDIQVLARHRSRIEETGVRLAVVSEPAAAVTVDKWMTAQFFRELGIPTPNSWLPDDLPDELAYPVFIKPRHGSAAKDAFKVRDAQELAFFLEFVPNPVVQEFLPGPEISNDVVCDLEGNVLAVVSRQRIEVRWGEVAKGVTVFFSDIQQACCKIAEALPAVGPITVQCILKNGKPYFTEINARLGGGLPLGIAAGADSPRWLLARLEGIADSIPPLGSYKTGLYLTRFDDSFFINEDELQTAAVQLV